MLHYYTSQNSFIRHVSRTICTAILLLMAFTIAKAQPCPTTPAAGRAAPTLETGVTTHVYPSALPAGVTVGTANVPYGAMIHDNSKGVISPLSTVTVHPQWSDGTMGWAIINFYFLEIANSGAIIKVYNGDGTATTPVATITSANASTYYRFNHKNNGPITVTMENTTNTGTGNFDVEVTYMTGDVVATSPFGQEITYYKEFITPNSHAYIDSRAGSTSTIATGYFDANRDLVSQELSWCIDYGRSAPRRGNWYPGGLVFNPTSRPDINEDGNLTIDDKLKTARLIYILQHAPQPITDPTNFGAVRAAVDMITRGLTTGGGQLAQDAINEIPSLPSPDEPTFSITGPSSPVAVGSSQNFVVNLTTDGGHPRIYTLKVPSGVTVNSVTGSGVTYNSSNQTITFASSPASATVSVTSSIGQTATVGVSYEQPGFWNVSNLIVYEPCDLYNQPGVSGRDYQAFLGISKSEKPYPIREASGTWDATLPVTLIRFDATKEGQTASLTWATTQETNSSYFEVQHSQNTKSWVALESVKSHGESAIERTYNYVHTQPVAGLNYYRLKMVDLDGTFAYSQIRSIGADKAIQSLVAYPNPVVNGKLTIDVATSGSYQAEVYNLSGVRVMQYNLGTGRELNVSSLNSGMYILSVKSINGEVQTRTFVVK